MNLTMIQPQDLAKSTTTLVVSCWSSEMAVMRRRLQRPYCSWASFCSQSIPLCYFMLEGVDFRLQTRDAVNNVLVGSSQELSQLGSHPGVVQTLKEGQLKWSWLLVMIWISLSCWPQRTPCLPALTSGHFAWISEWPGGRFKNAYELLNLRALKIPMLYKNRIFQCMSKIFCVEFQRVPLKFHTKYLTHTLKDVSFIHRWNFKSS